MPSIDEMFFRCAATFFTIVLGIIFLFFLYLFGVRLFSRESYHLPSELYAILHKYISDPKNNMPLMDNLSNWYQSHLEKRNDFWEHYGQVSLAVLIVIILAVLLLTKVITAEAGLPILSAVAGFAIAKTNSSSISKFSAIKFPRKAIRLYSIVGYALRTLLSSSPSTRNLV